MLPNLTDPLPEAKEPEADEPAPDSQFESFYDAESGTWTLRRIPSSPPASGVEDDAA